MYDVIASRLRSDKFWHFGTERGDTAPGESDLGFVGQYWRHLQTEWKLMFFQKSLQVCLYVPFMKKKLLKGTESC